MQSIEEQFIDLRRRYLELRFGALNEVQRRAVFKTEGPLLILAGAGSGKTTVLVNRIANLILFGHAYHAKQVGAGLAAEDVHELEKCLREQTAPSPQLAARLPVEPVRPWNIMAITFTNKAAGELKSRLASLLGQQVGGDVNASTFHSACVRILRRDAEKMGFPKSFTIYDTDDQQRVLKELYKNMNIDDKFLPVRAAASAIGRLKDRMIPPSEAAETALDARSQLVAQVYAAYAKRCRESGAMDFDDLIYYTVRLLREQNEVRSYYQNRFQYILVDEYQDTSVAQFQLVSLLCGPGQNVCVVGDDDQSIYRFRGATIENILSFELHFPGAEVIRLEQNYRSTGNILDAANCVIRNNEGRKGKTLWTDAGRGEKVRYYYADSELDEAAHIAQVIEENLEQGARLSDHVVLYRMNAQSSPVENYFTRAGIPHKIVGGLRFNDRKEIRDLHAYMSIVSSPQDDLRLRRVINEPARKIGNTTVDKIAEIAAGLEVPMLEVIKGAENYPALSRAAKALKGFYALYLRLVEAEEELPLEEFAAQVPEITGYTDMLLALGEEGATRLENIGQFVSNVKTYVDMNGEEASLEGYLEEIALISDIDSYDESADRVTLMTLHSAKGLEFPYVFIVGLEESIFPSEMSRFAPEDVEEERRLCYVGLTRAKKQLYLSSAATRLLYGQTRRNQPSRFLEEIDEELMEKESSPSLQAARMHRFSPFGSEGGGQRQNGYLDRNYNAAPAKRGNSRSAGMEARFASSLSSAKGPVKKVEGGSFLPGDRVKHKVFGEGVVEKVTPVGGDHLIEIEFEKVGRKKTMANYAPLEKMGVDG
ncbi:UvrD-helicase domain-containing protein [Ruminococcaceae bacterium OttesenSCG-928-I18]|nr:UvrD-helicase domain-containing protein [Ruminococcaceae bacterium OttesenSCG-928-I18]